MPDTSACAGGVRAGGKGTHSPLGGWRASAAGKTQVGGWPDAILPWLCPCARFRLERRRIACVPLRLPADDASVLIVHLIK